MTDPLSILASVLAVSAAAIKSSKTLFDLVDDVKSAPKVMRVISTDARALNSILLSLDNALKDARTNEVLTSDVALLERMTSLSSPLSICEKILAELVAKTESLELGSDSKGYRTTITRVNWALFTKREVKVLRDRLEVSKGTLTVALSGFSVVHLIAIGKCVITRPVRLLNQPPGKDFVTCRFIEGPVDRNIRPAMAPYTLMDSTISVKEDEEIDALIIPRVQKPGTGQSIRKPAQDGNLSGKLSPEQGFSLVVRELAANRRELDELRAAIKPKEPNSDELARDIENEARSFEAEIFPSVRAGSDEDFTSSISDIFFDCISRFSADLTSMMIEFQPTPSSSPYGVLETSSSFCPEGYTMQGLFSDQIFVFAVSPSQDSSCTQNYFLMYAKTPRKWQRISVSATFHGFQGQAAILGAVAPDKHDDQCKILPEPLRNQLNLIIPEIDLFTSVTKISVSFSEDRDGQLFTDPNKVKVIEDSLEVELSKEDQILSDIEDLGCPQFLETEIIGKSRISSSCFMVLVESQVCTERKVPFANSRKQGENPFQDYFKDLKLLHQLRGCPGIVKFVGVVLNDTRQHLKSYLYEYPALGTIMTITLCAISKSDTVSWPIRELWAHQIIRAISHLHSRGSLVGPAFSLHGVGVRADGSAVLTCIRTSETVYGNKRGLTAPELRNLSDGDGKTAEQMVNFRTEIFRLGLVLWVLAEHKTNLAGCFCLRSGCTNVPRYTCTADHTNPVALPDCSPDVPSYLNDLIKQCRLHDPKLRPTALKLAESLPEITEINQASMAESLQRFACPVSFVVYCSECGALATKNHYHCNHCDDADFDLCLNCYTNGIHCFDPQHVLMRRILRNDCIVEENLDGAPTAAGDTARSNDNFGPALENSPCQSPSH